MQRNQRTLNFSDINFRFVICLNNMLENVLASKTTVYIVELLYDGTLTFRNFEEP